jgi:hypothetical protein
VRRIILKLNKYEKFTDDLKEKLLNYNQVTGLVAVGSMSKKDHLPDEWSDHDFFVIVKSGYQKYFRENLSWLPDFENILLSFQETEHGLKVFYNNGHLIEFAVFDQEELFLAKINSYRILIDKANIKKNIEKIKDKTTIQTSSYSDNELLIEQFITNLVVGIGRYNRGEIISAHQFVKTSALKKLLLLIEKNNDLDKNIILDNLDPLRRFEFVYPELGAEINNLLLKPIPKAAEELLNILERELPEEIKIKHEKSINIIFEKYLK